MLAHSARPERGIPAQGYGEHILAVVRGADSRASVVEHYAPRRGRLLRRAVRLAAEFHDLGKLIPENQQVLRGCDRSRRLPVNHVDAGVAHLSREGGLIAATLVHAHHAGLACFTSEIYRKGWAFRDRDEETRGRTDACLADLVARHQQSLADEAMPPEVEGPSCNPFATLTFRLGLSCLVDADHTDTARHYRRGCEVSAPDLRPADRLAALDRHIAGLAGGCGEMASARQRLYESCRADDRLGLRFCEAPVGTGKTLAVMAHMLNVAHRHSLRRIFVVLPFTAIIDQAVEVYRRALVLPGEDTFHHAAMRGVDCNGEDAELVVAAHHCRAEYQSPDARHLAASWSAPVVVLTAVQFFETLAARSPARLRPLHQLPGSAVFVDESHACLPVHLWPVAWQWLQQLARDWGCHIVLGSGSMVRVWEIPELTPKVKEGVPPPPPPAVAPLGPAAGQETDSRVRYRTIDRPFRLEQLAYQIADAPGPRLAIVNTVQIAAALARLLADRLWVSRVEHLSTALAPVDRARTLDRIRGRTDTDWVLVATSCAECGLDLSFRTGFRQRASLTSLLQTGGRVNRSGEWPTCDVWDFRLIPGGLVNEDPPAFRYSAPTLDYLFRDGMVAPERCTFALELELKSALRSNPGESLVKREIGCDFPGVEEAFQVIEESGQVTAIVNPDLADRIEAGEPVGWQEIQRHAVQVRLVRGWEHAVREISGSPGVYRWMLPYNDRLGFMLGVLPLLDARERQGGETGHPVDSAATGQE